MEGNNTLNTLFLLICCFVPVFEVLNHLLYHKSLLTLLKKNFIIYFVIFRAVSLIILCLAFHYTVFLSWPSTVSTIVHIKNIFFFDWLFKTLWYFLNLINLILHFFHKIAIFLLFFTLCFLKLYQLPWLITHLSCLRAYFVQIFFKGFLIF